LRREAPIAHVRTTKMYSGTAAFAIDWRGLETSAKPLPL